jgi:hypothetical protein
MARLSKGPVKIEDTRVIWGKFLLKLRKEGEQSLHALCVELNNFEIVDKNFVVTVSKKINFDSLNKLQNVKKANEIFGELGVGLTIQFVYNPSIGTNDDKIKILSDILGCKVIKK